MVDVPAAQDNLRSRVGKGAIWTAASQIVRSLATFSQVVVLSRLLSPSDFGVVAMCSPVVVFISLFQDLGLSQATVQKAKISYEQMSALFWINVAVSTLLGLVVILIAPVAAWFYDEPRVLEFLMATSVSMVIGGLAAQHSALLTRLMQFGKLATISTMSSIAGLAAAILSAVYGLSYWSLYIGSLFALVVNTAGLWLLTRWIPSKPQRGVNTTELLSFGAGVTGFNLANFFARNVDSVLIGRFWGGVQLGLYDRANKLLLVPLSQVMGPLSAVMVPALSRVHDDHERYRGAYIRALSAALILVLPGIAFATAKSETLVPFVLGPNWIDTSQIFKVLGFASIVQAMNNPAGWLFISQGRSSEFFRWGIVSTITVCVGFVAGLKFGAYGVAVGYAIGEYIRTPLLWIYVGRRGPVRTTDVVEQLAHLPIASLIAVAVVTLTNSVLPTDNLSNLSLSLVICLSVFYPLAFSRRSSRRLLVEVALLGKEKLQGLRLATRDTGN